LNSTFALLNMPSLSDTTMNCELKKRKIIEFSLLNHHLKEDGTWSFDNGYEGGWWFHVRQFCGYLQPRLSFQITLGLVKSLQNWDWCVPFGTQRVETEGVSKRVDIEINPKAESHPGTNQA
jgi:hypothetical protein